MRMMLSALLPLLFWAPSSWAQQCQRCQAQIPGTMTQQQIRSIFNLVREAATNQLGMELFERYLAPHEATIDGCVYTGTAFAGFRLVYPHCQQ